MRLSFGAITVATCPTNIQLELVASGAPARRVTSSFHLCTPKGQGADPAGHSESPK